MKITDNYVYSAFSLDSAILQEVILFDDHTANVFNVWLTDLRSFTDSGNSLFCWSNSKNVFLSLAILRRSVIFFASASLIILSFSAFNLASSILYAFGSSMSSGITSSGDAFCNINNKIKHGVILENEKGYITHQVFDPTKQEHEGKLK